MKNLKRAVRKITFVWLGILMMIVLQLIGGGSSVAKPIEMSWLSFLPRTNQSVQGLQKYLFDRINEKAKGQMVIKYRGGPEVISGYDIGAAVQKGIIDFAMVPVGYYEPLAPGVAGAQLTQISLDEERRPGGGYDYLVELHRKGGLMYLGRAAHTTHPYFFLFLNKWPQTQNDFKGIKIGSSAGSRPAVAGWGGTHTGLAHSEYYPALQQGVIDGLAGVPLVSAADLGIQEVVKYVADHPYWVSTAVAIMNLNSWNKLSKNLQDIIMTTMIQAEKDQMKQDDIDRPAAREKFIKAGVQFRTFPPEMAKWYLETAYNAGWEFQQRRFPDVTPKLRELLSKK